MKKTILFSLATLMLTMSAFAQNSIQLNIHHKLANADFAFNVGAVNNMGHDFNVTRLQYYISEIAIIHDGGTETTIKNYWILADAGKAVQANLGNYDITEVEAVHFHIGVDSSHNHLDPAAYQAFHPLAPQNPSMHWGWVPGYRFVAFEGNGSSNYNQAIQIHGLGDDNYFKTEVAVSASAQNNAVVIDIDADYTRALEDIAVNAGIYIHAEFGAAKQMIENFRDYVFSPSNGASGTIDFSEVKNFQVFPNPAQNGKASLLLESTENRNYVVMVSDILGRVVQRIDPLSSNTTVDLNLKHSGLHIISLIKDGQAVITKKLMAN